MLSTLIILRFLFQYRRHKYATEDFSTVHGMVFIYVFPLNMKKTIIIHFPSLSHVWIFILKRNPSVAANIPFPFHFGR